MCTRRGGIKVTDDLRLHELTYAEIGQLFNKLQTELTATQTRIVELMTELERTQKELANKYV